MKKSAEHTLCASERATGVEPVNLFLGKEAFYQLNYARISSTIILGFKKVVNNLL